MRALVIFESMFGNTQQIAHAVAAGLSAHVQVDLVEVGGSGPVDPDLDLLVIGAPTQAFGLSRVSTREGALKQAPNGIVSRGAGIREWLAGLAEDAPTVPVATFDTRFDKPVWLTGSAAHSAERRLRRRGHPIAGPATSFFVEGTPGPLREGEVDRARAWGERLGATLAAAGSLDAAS